MSNRKAINELFQVHEAVLNHVQSIESSIDVMMPLTVQPLSTPNEIKLIWENIRNIGLALYYLKEGEINHENLDKDVLRDFINENEIGKVDEEHVGIARALDHALMQIELARSEKWNAGELTNCLKNLKRSVHEYHELVIEHTLKENELLKRGLSNLE
jgi:hypothetical protein